MKYRKKPALTEATQWFRNGDHPQDQSEPIDGQEGTGKLTEGKVVGFFRSLKIPGGRFCPECGNVMQKHGMLRRAANDMVLADEEIICPGDYVVTDQKGRYYRVTAVQFEAQYEPYEVTPHQSSRQTE